MRIRKTAPPAPTPERLLDELRTAQDAHAAAVSAANGRLIDTHSNVLAVATDRAAVIEEQVTLLQAEASGLVKVAQAAGAVVGTSA